MDVFIRKERYRGPLLAAVLDWAGTVVDHGCIGPVAVFVKVFEKRGVAPTLAEAREPMGLAKKDHIRAMCAMVDLAERWKAVHGVYPGEAEIDAMYLETEPAMVEVIPDHAEVIPGALDGVNGLRALGLKIGTSTGYTKPMMEVLVPLAANQGYTPDAVFCSSDAPKGRPYPYMAYLNALALEVFPFEAMLKVGDTVSDIQEGLNAGMWTVGLTRTGNELGLTEAEAAGLDPAELDRMEGEVAEKLVAAGAHYTVSCLADVPALAEEINKRLADGESPLP